MFVVQVYVIGVCEKDWKLTKHTTPLKLTVAQTAIVNDFNQLRISSLLVLPNIVLLRQLGLFLHHLLPNLTYLTNLPNDRYTLYLYIHYITIFIHTYTPFSELNFFWQTLA